MRTDKTIVMRPANTPRTSSSQRRKLPRTIIHKRCAATVIPDITEKASGAGAGIEAFVTDFTIKGLGLNTDQYVSPKTQITVQIRDKNNEYTLQGEIAWCYKMPSSGRVLKDDKAPTYSWRMGLLLVMRGPEDLKQVEALTRELNLPGPN